MAQTFANSLTLSELRNATPALSWQDLEQAHSIQQEGHAAAVSVGVAMT